MLNRFRTTLEGREEGHISSLAGSLVAAIGAIVLAIGAANANDATVIAGGIVMAVGFVGGALYFHSVIDWGIFSRLDKLEKDD